MNKPPPHLIHKTASVVITDKDGNPVDHPPAPKCGDTREDGWRFRSWMKKWSDKDGKYIWKESWASPEAYEKHQRSMRASALKRRRSMTPEQKTLEKRRRRLDHHKRMRNDPEYAEKQREKARLVMRRRLSDPVKRLIQQCRVKLSQACRAKSEPHKPHKYNEIFGCSIWELRDHIQSKFQNGMNWENHGEWQVDHIKPIKSFPQTQEGILQSFNFHNLQPLWAWQNREKERMGQSSKKSNLEF